MFPFTTISKVVVFTITVMLLSTPALATPYMSGSERLFPHSEIGGIDLGIGDGGPVYEVGNRPFDSRGFANPDPTGDMYNIDFGVHNAASGPVSLHATFNNLTFGVPNPEQNASYLDLDGFEGLLDGQIHDVSESAVVNMDGTVTLDFVAQMRTSAFPNSEFFPDNLSVGQGTLTNGLIFLGDVDSIANDAALSVLTYTISGFATDGSPTFGPMNAIGSIVNNTPWDGVASAIIPDAAGLGTTRIEIEIVLGVPEPTSLLLLGVGIAMITRRRSR